MVIVQWYKLNERNQTNSIQPQMNADKRRWKGQRQRMAGADSITKQWGERKAFEGLLICVHLRLSAVSNAWFRLRNDLEQGGSLDGRNIACRLQTGGLGVT